MRRSTLYGPRVQGDLDLGLEPSRIRAGVKDWSRADFPGGKVPGGSNQEVYEQSVGTTPNYRIGTRRVQDERTFHYCKADANGWTVPYWAAVDTQKYSNDDLQDCIEGNTTANPGLTTDFTVRTADAGAHAADFFAGGWAVLTVGSVIREIRIRSSTATADDDAGFVTLTLWEPLALEVAQNSQLQVFPSHYGLVGSAHTPGTGGPEWVVVCVPIIPVTAEHYFWGQTWGPCYGIPSGPTFPRRLYELELIFNAGDGSLSSVDYILADRWQQRAGYRLISYSNDPPGLLLHYMLQIKP